MSYSHQHSIVLRRAPRYLTSVQATTSARVALAMLITVTAMGQQPAEVIRKYEDGPLTINDYESKPPESGSDLDAITTSDLKYEFTYQVRVAGRRATAYVKELTIHAIMKPEASWNRRPNDKRLLDHEQGHFDITYGWALKARAHFAKLLNGPNRLTSVASTPEAAIAGLHKELERQMQPFFDGAVNGHHEYDRVTAHGTRPEPQAEQRKLQRAMIKEYTTETPNAPNRTR